MTRLRRFLLVSIFVISGFLGAAPFATADEVTTQACEQKSTLAGTHLTDKQIAQYARNAGLRGNGLVISIAVALAESQGWTRAVLINTDCSRDRGVWQINSYWHSEVSDTQAFNPASAATATYTISSGGSNWTPWVTYNNGAYQQYLARARTAAAAVGG
ncbi:hypothetical protein SAMN05421504_108111 [Amycolatopsis xylanica]|uniref:Transglycosylase SLT domain-containing protein n=1 Tax=Amycolatopsis xylanica TaxID=589385 RepID=A0A1H3PAP8_9PSEU|nr:hypothetical protein [Amycolatopsis xylanica]SDY98151.1 hypothetical protein SAMN05421504_108111 [Amycolatopsis xylanica]